MLITGYKMKRKIKDGGFSTVYEAVRLRDKERIAIKVLSEAGIKAGEKSAFTAEVRLLQGLSHDYVIDVHELIPGAERPAYSMEYFESMSLRAAILKYPDEIANAAPQVMHRITSALAYIHSEGITHRDLKPENILVSTAGDVRLIDFSIARRDGKKTGLWARIAGMLGKKKVQGTPQYMAPEQFRNEPTDQRTDVYALGCIFVEVLTGKPVFSAATPAKLAKAHCGEKPPSAARLDKHMPFRLAEMVVKMLSKKREYRPEAQAVLALMDELPREDYDK